MRTTRCLSATATRLFTTRRTTAADRGWYSAADRHADRVSVETAMLTGIRRSDR